GPGRLKDGQRGRAFEALKAISAADDFKIAEFAQARLSGPSRLAFDVAPDEKKGVTPIAFTVNDLTDWARFSLKVVLRARKFQPTITLAPARPTTPASAPTLPVTPAAASSATTLASTTADADRK